MKIELNQPAPDFTLTDSSGKKHTLSDYKGSYILLYFYPKDDTAGCTKEACSIRDNYPHFGKLGITVFGISADSEESHKKFEEKYQLPFTLLSDPDHAVCELYGVWGLKKMMGKEYMGINRMSFLINAYGKVVKVYEKVVPDVHADEVIADVRALTH